MGTYFDIGEKSSPYKGEPGKHISAKAHWRN